MTSSLTSFTTQFYSYMQTVDSTFAAQYGLPWLIAHGYKMYLMISNTAHQQQSFCFQTLSTPTQVAATLPTDSYFLQSQASYDKQQVGLDASYAQPIPGFLFSTVGME